MSDLAPPRGRPGPAAQWSDPWCTECQIPVSRVDEDGCCLACGTDVMAALHDGYPHSFGKAIAQGRHHRASWIETWHADRWFRRLCSAVRGEP